MAKSRGTKFPTPVARRSGCKVGWEYFASKEDAEARAVTARADAEHLAERGYDFGWQTPGRVTEVRHGEHAGLWEVVIP